MEYKKGYKYQLNKDEALYVGIYPKKCIRTDWIDLYENGYLVLRKGYAWDGASNAIDTKNFMRGSAAHDALYQLMALGYLDKSYRKEADKILVDICKNDGMSEFRALYVYWAVRIFGGAHLMKEKIYEVGNESN